MKYVSSWFKLFIFALNQILYKASWKNFQALVSKSKQLSITKID